MNPNGDERSLFHEIKTFFRDEDEGVDLAEDEYEDRHGHIYSDEELENVVKELFHHSTTVDGEDITVRAYNSDVTLSGTVKSEDQKNAAGSLVQLIHGVGLIRNELIVKLNDGILPTDIGRD